LVPDATQWHLVERAAGVLQIARSSAYQLARDDPFPSPVIRISPTRVRVMTIPLLRSMGLDYEVVPDQADGR
jgi:hypothetical protein